MEVLWDRLRSSEEEIESPDWHRGELERREQMIQNGEAHFIPWPNAKESIQKRVQ